jgi:hypothetical protein
MVRLLSLTGYDAQLSTPPLLACFTDLANPGSATGYGQRELSREREIPKVISQTARKNKRHFGAAASAARTPWNSPFRRRFFYIMLGVDPF